MDKLTETQIELLQQFHSDDDFTVIDALRNVLNELTARILVLEKRVSELESVDKKRESLEPSRVWLLQDYHGGGVEFARGTVLERNSGGQYSRPGAMAGDNAVPYFSRIESISEPY